MQLEDTIERLDTVSVGMLMPDRAAPVAEAELLGLDELGDVELGDVEAELALRSSVPVIRTLWFTCALRSTDAACARNAYDVPPIALDAELDGVEVDGAVEPALVSPSFWTFVRMYWAPDELELDAALPDELGDDDGDVEVAPLELAARVTQPVTVTGDPASVARCDVLDDGLLGGCGD